MCLYTLNISRHHLSLRQCPKYLSLQEFANNASGLRARDKKPVIEEAGGCLICVVAGMIPPLSIDVFSVRYYLFCPYVFCLFFLSFFGLWADISHVWGACSALPFLPKHSPDLPRGNMLCAKARSLAPLRRSGGGGKRQSTELFVMFFCDRRPPTHDDAKSQ